MALALVLGLLGLFGWHVAIVIASAGLAAIALTSDAAVRRRALRAASDARRKRRDRRELELEEAGVRWADLNDLTDVVEVVTRAAPREAKFYQLDDLLDLYAKVAIARRAYRAKISRVPVMLSDHASPLRRAIRLRALSLQQICSERAATCDRLLEEMAELVRLYASRAMMAHLRENAPRQVAPIRSLG